MRNLIRKILKEDKGVKEYDVQTLRFLADNKTDIYLINPQDGKPFTLSKHNVYKHDGKTVVYHVDTNNAGELDLCWYRTKKTSMGSFEVKVGCSGNGTGTVLRRFNEGTYIPKDVYAGKIKTSDLLSVSSTDLFNNLNENDFNDWGIESALPKEFVITYCETPISLELLKRFEDAMPNYRLGSDFDQGLPDQEWIDSCGRHGSKGVVMYYKTKGYNIEWEGWDTCSDNTVSSYDYVFTIEEFLKAFSK